MLTKNDKKWMRETFKELITEALTVDIAMVQKRDAETGAPLKVEKHFTKSVYLPDHWVEFLPYYEQAIVAMEELTAQARNRSIDGKQAVLDMEVKLDAIGGIYKALERPLKVLAKLSDILQNQNELTTLDKKLELIYKNESDPKRRHNSAPDN